MTSPVTIKGNQQGLRLIIEKDAYIEDVVSTIKNGLKNNVIYDTIDKKHDIKLIFEGQDISFKDKLLIQNLFLQYGIKCYIENKHEVTDKISSYNNFLPKDEGLFLFGNIRRGEVIEAKTSIVIIGDVEKGARVYSNANIVIIGKQEGLVQSGIEGSSTSFVYSMISGRNM